MERTQAANMSAVKRQRYDDLTLKLMMERPLVAEYAADILLNGLSANEDGAVIGTIETCGENLRISIYETEVHINKQKYPMVTKWLRYTMRIKLEAGRWKAGDPSAKMVVPVEPEEGEEDLGAEAWQIIGPQSKGSPQNWVFYLYHSMYRPTTERRTTYIKVRV